MQRASNLSHHMVPLTRSRHKTPHWAETKLKTNSAVLHRHDLHTASSSLVLVVNAPASLIEYECLGRSKYVSHCRIYRIVERSRAGSSHIAADGSFLIPLSALFDPIAPYRNPGLQHSECRRRLPPLTLASPSHAFPIYIHHSMCTTHPSATERITTPPKTANTGTATTPRGFNTTPSEDSIRSLNVRRRLHASVWCLQTRSSPRRHPSAFLIVMTKRQQGASDHRPKKDPESAASRVHKTRALVIMNSKYETRRRKQFPELGNVTDVGPWPYNTAAC